MYQTKNKLPNCKECKIGFVELNENNWKCVGILETYGIAVFVDGMGGINTNSIKNILEAEGCEGDEYRQLFHSLVLFLTTALSTSRNK